ncbi:MAG: ATPase domain-containing protein [Candidatus Krumholzibacteriia bacterium]
MNNDDRPSLPRCATGIKGLDHILRGGIPSGQTHLVHGGPGAGKTTLGLQFLMDGRDRGERVLYATLLQTREELESAVHGHGWDLDGIDLMEMPPAMVDDHSSDQTLFVTAEVELNEAAEAIVKAIERHRPQRMVLDSISELAVLVDSNYPLRRQLLRIKRSLARYGCTGIFIAGEGREEDLESTKTMLTGVIHLRQTTPEFGPPHRSLRVSKMRGMVYAGGWHDFRIVGGGIVVFPRLEIPRNAPRSKPPEIISCGVAEIDAMLGGGMEEGTSCLVAGSTGAGKSTFASLYVQAVAARGERAVVFCFDERREMFLRRSDGLGMDISRLVAQGKVDLRQVDLGELTSGEFLQSIRRAVDEDGVRVVVIDSLTGYFASMPHEEHLTTQLHELLGYTGQAGALSFLVMSSHSLNAPYLEMLVDPSYLADTVVMVRLFESRGRIHRCIAVMKKRTGRHEESIREFRLGAGGIRVGAPLVNFSGVLGGTPRYEGPPADLMDNHEACADDA